MVGRVAACGDCAARDSRFETRTDQFSQIFKSSIFSSNLFKCCVSVTLNNFESRSNNNNSKTSFEKNCFSAWASTLNMGLINKVDMVCLSPVGYGV